MSAAITKKFTRQEILDMESLLSSHPDAEFGDSNTCPVKHLFSDGIYTRKMFIPAGTALVGKIHKHQHPGIVMSGTIRVATEDGCEEITGPEFFISKPGIKRVGFAVTDVEWITIHPNPSNETNIKKLENNIIAKDYEALEQFRRLESKPIRSFLKSIIRRLS